MSVTLWGALCGLGIWLALKGLRPTEASLAQRLAVLEPPPSSSVTVPVDAGWASLLGQRLTPLVARCGLPRPSIHADLRLLERPVEIHRAEQATAALAGLCLPLLLAALLGLCGIGVFPVTLVASPVMAAAMGLAVDSGVRSRAAARREDLRYALTAVLDLTVTALAGGAGIEQALGEATSIGTGYGFDLLRRTLTRSRITRTPPAREFADLGARVGIDELAEVAAALELAGSEGARIRASLTAKAQALRAARLAAIEEHAHAATERMSLPTTVMLTGFLLFIGYPAVTTVFTLH